MDAATAALLGAAIGAIGSVGGVWLQQRHQTVRDRLKVAADLGLADFNKALELARSHDREVAIPPLSAYVLYHADFLDALAKGSVAADTIEKLNARQEELLKVFPDPAKKKQ